MLIDTHAHIYSADFTDDLDEMLFRASQAGIAAVCMPNIDHESIEPMLAIAKKYSWCHAMMGLHPCHVKENYKEELATVEAYLSRDTFCAVGEIGIDLYWDKTYVDEQMEAFRFQIALAKEAGLPIVIHSRDSLDQTIQTVQNMQDGNLRGVFHCFNGTDDQAQKIIDLGFFMGIGGVLTYKNAGVDKVVANLPLANLVLETDAPYLSPVPYRGKRNECAYVAGVAEKLAMLKEISLNEVASITTKNAISLFGLNKAQDLNP
jgi:TatD DNase family protein